MRLPGALSVLPLLILSAAVASAGPLCQSASNMIQNCGFEDGLSWWSTGGNWATGYNDPSPGASHSGTYSLKLGNYPSQGVAGVWNYMTDIPGEIYTLSFWLSLSADNNQGGDQQFYLVAFGPQGLLVERNQPSTSWVFYTFDVVGTGRDMLQFCGYSNHGYNYLDDVQFFRRSSVAPDAVPEAGTFGLLLSGLVAFAARIYRRGRPV